MAFFYARIMRPSDHKDFIDRLAKALLMTLDAIEEPKLESFELPALALPKKKHER